MTAQGLVHRASVSPCLRGECTQAQPTASDNRTTWKSRSIACASATSSRFCVLALLCLGVVMVQSAAMNVTGRRRRGTGRERGTKHARLLRRRGSRRSSLVGHIDYAWLGRRDDADLASTRSSGCCVVAVVLDVLRARPGHRHRSQRRPPVAAAGAHAGAAVGAGEVGGRAVPRVVADAPAGRPRAVLHAASCRRSIPIGVICLLIVIQDFGTAALIGALRADDAARRPREAGGTWRSSSRRRWRRRTGSSCTRSTAGRA